MGEIVLTRIDDRLIHGQVMTAWVKKTKANQIIIVDDEVSKDEFMSEILKMSAPSGIEIVVLDKENAVSFLNDIPETKHRAIILVKSPLVIKYLMDEGVQFQHIIVGGMGAKENRTVLYKNISASEEERNIFKEIIHSGVKVTIHIIPDQKEVDLSKYLN